LDLLGDLLFLGRNVLMSVWFKVFDLRGRPYHPLPSPIALHHCERLEELAFLDNGCFEKVAS
jgi:hypothetical protein